MDQSNQDITRECRWCGRDLRPAADYCTGCGNANHQVACAQRKAATVVDPVSGPPPTAAEMYRAAGMGPPAFEGLPAVRRETDAMVQEFRDQQVKAGEREQKPIVRGGCGRDGDEVHRMGIVLIVMFNLLLLVGSVLVALALWAVRQEH